MFLFCSCLSGRWGCHYPRSPAPGGAGDDPSGVLVAAAGDRDVSDRRVQDGRLQICKRQLVQGDNSCIDMYRRSYVETLRARKETSSNKCAQTCRRRLSARKVIDKTRLFPHFFLYAGYSLFVKLLLYGDVGRHIYPAEKSMFSSIALVVS